jgi:hypothetical protein
MLSAKAVTRYLCLITMSRHSFGWYLPNTVLQMTVLAPRPSLPLTVAILAWKDAPLQFPRSIRLTFVEEGKLISQCCSGEKTVVNCCMVLPVVGLIRNLFTELFFYFVQSHVLKYAL